MGYHLGIDAGTTYTAAAVYRDGQVEIVPLGDRAASIPSVIFLKPDGSVLTGDAAYRRGLAEPERVALEFKRRIGDATSILLGGTPYSAEALMARLFRWTVDKVAALEGGPAETIAVTHPANWGEYKLDRLNQAIRMADLPEAVTLSEPEAAAVHYASNERVEAGSVIAVYDLGGGTFDAAVLRKNDAGWEILGTPEGIEQLGGIDIDEAVYDHVRRSAPDAFTSLDLSVPATRTAITRLRRDCIEAKEALSSDTDVNIAVLLPDTQTHIRLTRSELESMIGPTLDDTVGAMDRALRSADVTPGDVTAVLLVGGSSRIPMVAGLVSDAFGRPVAVDTHPKHAIALGAALAAAESAGVHVGSVASAPAPEPQVAPPPLTVEPEPETATETDPEPEPISADTEPITAVPPPPPDRPVPDRPPPPPPSPVPDPAPPPEPPPAPPTEPVVAIDDGGPEPPDDRRRLMIVGGALGLLLLVVAGAVWALSGDGDGDDPGTETASTDTTDPADDEAEPDALDPVDLVAGRSFPTSRFPDGVDVDQDGNIWVAVTFADQVQRIDPVTGATEAAELPFGPGDGGDDGPDPLALTVDGDGFVWVSFRNVPTVVRIDPQTLTSTGQVAVRDTPRALVERDGLLYVSTAGGVDLVETASMQAVATVDVASPSGIALSDEAAWVVGRDDQAVIEIERATFELTGRSFPTGEGPDGVTVDVLGNLWVTNRDGGAVTWIDPETEETEEIDVGANPADITTDGQGGVWISDNGAGAVVLIDPYRREVVEVFDVGPSPLGLTAFGDTVFVSVTGDDQVRAVVAAGVEPSDPFAEITDIRIENQRFIVAFESWNYVPDIADAHTHFFWNSVPPGLAGVPEAGPWLVWGVDDAVDDEFFDLANRPDGATAICALVADATHAVGDVDGDGSPDPDAGNCLRLPEAADAG